jgi:hypothetical protein
MKRREACSSLLLLLVAALCATAVRAQLAGEDARFTVGHYDVELEPNLASRSITGTVDGMFQIDAACTRLAPVIRACSRRAQIHHRDVGVHEIVSLEEERLSRRDR